MDYFVTVSNGEEQDTLAGFMKGHHAETFMKAIQAHYSEEKLVKMITSAGMALTVNIGFIFDRWAKSGVWSKIVSASHNSNSKAHFVARSVTNIHDNKTLNPRILSVAVAMRLVRSLQEVEIIDKVKADTVISIIH